MKVGDQVIVKECQPDAIYNDIMYSDRHGDWKGTTTTVTKITGSNRDKCSLECAPHLLFGKDMLLFVSGSETNEPQCDQQDEVVHVVNLSYDVPTKVIYKMKERHQKFDGAFTNKDTYREAFRDKLETTLTILLKK